MSALERERTTHHHDDFVDATKAMQEERSTAMTSRKPWGLVANEDKKDEEVNDRSARQVAARLPSVLDEEEKGDLFGACFFSRAPSIRL